MDASTHTRLSLSKLRGGGVVVNLLAFKFWARLVKASLDVSISLNMLVLWQNQKGRQTNARGIQQILKMHSYLQFVCLLVKADIKLLMIITRHSRSFAFFLGVSFVLFLLLFTILLVKYLKTLK